MSDTQARRRMIPVILPSCAGGPLVRHIIEEEFGQRYHAGHVRKLLRQLGYSMQRPTTRLVQADAEQHRKWVRYTYPNPKKTPKAKGR